ncbi:MAG: hypothetical protein MJ237_00570 [bacterium]|nr:hypothetical protein [bacterium]
MVVKLSAKAVERFGQLFRQYTKAPTQELKAKMISLFASQIERQAATAAAKSGGKISSTDYAQDLYLKFLEKLETIKPEGEYPVKALSKTMNETKPTADTLITFGRKTVGELTPLEELRLASYRIDEQTFFQKAKEIVYSSKDLLSYKESKVLSEFFKGKSFKEIGCENNMTDKEVKNIYENAIRRLSTPPNKIKASRIFYDDLPLNEISLDESMVRDVLNERIRNWYNYEKGITAFNINGKASSSTRFLELVKNGNMHIKLPKEYNTPEFKKMAEELEVKYYGKKFLIFD